MGRSHEQPEGSPVNAPHPIPTTWTTGTTEAIKTGTWRAALPHYIHASAPCHRACPVDGDIAHGSTRQQQHDRRRRTRVEHCGWDVGVVTGALVNSRGLAFERGVAELLGLAVAVLGADGTAIGVLGAGGTART